MAARTRTLAGLLSTRHEVTLISALEMGGDRGRRWPGESPIREVVAELTTPLRKTVFASEDHRLSAAVLEAIEGAYGSRGPDYVEVCDRRALGLVPMQARRGGSPLFEPTRFGVRLTESHELTSLHDGTLGGSGQRLAADLEREQFRLADLIVWPGGDGLDAYRRYHELALPEAFQIAEPPPAAVTASSKARDHAGGMRLLYCAPLQRSRGALDLAEACLRLPFEDWMLTMAGTDTETAPGGQSVRLTIEEMFAEDPRLAIEDPPALEGIGDLFSRHDLLVVPARFGVWPMEAVVGMAAGLPVLATPVGGLTEIVEPGVSGWLADDLGPIALRRALEALLGAPGEFERLRDSSGPAERSRRLSDREEILDGYDQMLDREQPKRAPSRRLPSGPAKGALVTGIVPYYHAAAHVEAAVDSLLAQTHPAVEALIVNDGSFEEADEVLGRLSAWPRVRVVTQLNGGEAAARNLGACVADGEYLVMLDADNELEPEFVERALAVLRASPRLAYVSCWLRFIGADGSPTSDPAGYAALGNRVYRGDDLNLDGDTLALLPRRIFSELGYGYELECAAHPDWELYRTLRLDGLFGAVIPERLARYRVLPDSLMRTYDEEMLRRSSEEMRDRPDLRGTRWVAEVDG
jgi:glycosyltransferase involved in cell wall biosynthesis